MAGASGPWRYLPGRKGLGLVGEDGDADDDGFAGEPGDEFGQWRDADDVVAGLVGQAQHALEGIAVAGKDGPDQVTEQDDAALVAGNFQFATVFLDPEPAPAEADVGVGAPGDGPEIEGGDEELETFRGQSVVGFPGYEAKTGVESFAGPGEGGRR